MFVLRAPHPEEGVGLWRTWMWCDLFAICCIESQGICKILDSERNDLLCFRDYGAIGRPRPAKVPPAAALWGPTGTRGGTEGDGHSKGGGRIERWCRDRETVGTGARYRRGGGTGGQIGLVAPRAHTHGVGTRGTQLRWGDRGTCYGTSTVGGTLRGTSRAWYIHGVGTRGTQLRWGDRGTCYGTSTVRGTLRGTSRAWYIHGGGTRGTNWTCSTSGAHTRCGDKGDTAAVGGQGEMLRNIDSGRDVKRDITCLAHTRWRDKGDNLFTRYIRGGGDKRDNSFTVISACWDEIMCKVHTRWGDKRDNFFTVISGCWDEIMCIVHTWWGDKGDISGNTGDDGPCPYILGQNDSRSRQ
ncbi:hypothetical protein B0H16DRAFT_1482018 [Mycena metata]|uniref:Uncharacterized protein n=1 Tax=Mycena metata TaxID=1033252 RepID=A0AAD7GV80_9AGAR|nr:hypothetical protein B0H16DRAFT_1482018 [Mycena metata]